MTAVEGFPKVDGLTRMGVELRRWCERNRCTHAHCPLGCEHPQPFIHPEDGILYCGTCYYAGERLTMMQPCTPETCKD